MLVVDADEKQSLRRRGLAGLAAVAGGEHFGRPVDVALAAADFDERADDRSHHVVEEAVAGDFDRDAVGSSCIRVSATSTRQLVNRADRIGPLGAGRFEAGEIVAADERPALPRASPPHRAAADSARRSGDRTPTASGRCEFGSDSACRRHRTWRESLRGPLRSRPRRCRSGSSGIEAAVQVVVREARLGRKADDLPERVDAGVGAAGGGDADRFLRELLPGRFERALHRRLVGLNLPAGVRACRRRPRST